MHNGVQDLLGLISSQSREADLELAACWQITPTTPWMNNRSRSARCGCSNMLDTFTSSSYRTPLFLLFEISARVPNWQWACRKTRLHACEQSRLADQGWLSGSTVQSRIPALMTKGHENARGSMVLTSTLGHSMNGLTRWWWSVPEGSAPPGSYSSFAHHLWWWVTLQPVYILCFHLCFVLMGNFWNLGKKFTPPLQILSSPQTLPQTPSGKISAHSESFSAFYALKAFCTATHDLRHWTDIALADVHAPAFREDCNLRFAWLLSPPCTLHMAEVRAMGPFHPQVTACSILLHMVVLNSTEWCQ